MNKPVCYAKGAFLSTDGTSVSVNDLGLQRGYGIFDFLRVSNNIPLFIEDHLDRFYNSASEMRLSVKETRDEIKEIIYHLINKNNLPISGIRILLTGGESPDGYKIIEPRLVIVQQHITPPLDEMTFTGIHLLSYSFQRQLSHVKTTDYLMAIWLQPWLKKGGGDDLLYHQAGMITECPRSNFFMVTKDGKLVTPGTNILKGITRKQVIRLALESGLKVEERDIHISELREATEAFITSSTKRIIPVRQLDDFVFPAYSLNSVLGRLWQSFLEYEGSIVIKP